MTVTKENGVTQRSDITLTKETAVTLSQNILLGRSLLTREAEKKGVVELIGNDGGLVTVPYHTLRMWIVRKNVIPETGNVLRDILDEAREEYRNIKKREMDEKREEVIDKKFNRVISMRTKEPAVGMFGVVKDPITKKPVYIENVKLLAEQMKNVRFLAERLYSNRYGKVMKSENKNLTLSLSDLRKYEERQK